MGEPRYARIAHHPCKRIDINSDTAIVRALHDRRTMPGLFRSITSSGTSRRDIHAGDPRCCGGDDPSREGGRRRRRPIPLDFLTLVGFGRAELNVTPRKPKDLRALPDRRGRRVAAPRAWTIQHVKPHGALFNMACAQRGGCGGDRGARSPRSTRR
jgi:hypothetical protein